MSRKNQIADMVAERPRTTREIAEALGIKTTTATVAVAMAQNYGLIRMVGTHKRASGKPVYVWGPPAPPPPRGDGKHLQEAWR